MPLYDTPSVVNLTVTWNKHFYHKRLHDLLLRYFCLCDIISKAMELPADDIHAFVQAAFLHGH